MREDSPRRRERLLFQLEDIASTRRTELVVNVSAKSLRSKHSKFAFAWRDPHDSQKRFSRKADSLQEPRSRFCKAVPQIPDREIVWVAIFQQSEGVFRHRPAPLSRFYFSEFLPRGCLRVQRLQSREDRTRRPSWQDQFSSNLPDWNILKARLAKQSGISNRTISFC